MCGSSEKNRAGLINRTARFFITLFYKIAETADGVCRELNCGTGICSRVLSTSVTGAAICGMCGALPGHGPKADRPEPL